MMPESTALEAAQSTIGKISRVFPFVRIYCDPSTATEENPNGIQVDTNMSAANRPGWEFMVMRMLMDGGHRWTTFLHAKSAQKVSTTGLVLPDGSPAPLPKE